MNYEMDHDQRFIPARWSDQIGFTLKHVKVHLQIVESLPVGSGMVMSSSSWFQLAAITPICSRPGGVANLSNGVNDTIRAYSPGGCAHDITGTQGDTGTLTHNPLDSNGDHFTLNTVDRLN
jgi:hypothetical protein